MFWFYIWVPQVVLPEDECRPIANIKIKWFWETLSWSTRKDFIDAWIVDIYAKYITVDVINNWYDTPIKYSKVKKCLEKIRYKSKIYWTDVLWIDDAINNAIKKYWEKNLYCIFE